MAERYNYSGGRGGSSSMYRYNEPSVSQYESFFNPIPLEFVQQNLQQHQQKYDVGYGEALAAKDMYGGAEVSENDIANKNKIVGDFTNNMDTVVKEKYGGDWGRASKEVARMVTSVRQNPFWDTAKILKERQAEERKRTSEYGNNTLVFKSLMGQGSIDPATGKTITPDQLQYDILEKGDWNKTIQEVIGKINPDSNPYGLSKEDFGFLRSGQITEISPTKLKKIAEDPNIQQAIISAHPEMARAFNELPKQKSSLFGEDADTLQKGVQNLIYGNINSQQYKQNEQQRFRKNKK